MWRNSLRWIWSLICGHKRISFIILVLLILASGASFAKKDISQSIGLSVFQYKSSVQEVDDLERQAFEDFTDGRYREAYEEITRAIDLAKDSDTIASLKVSQATYEKYLAKAIPPLEFTQVTAQIDRNRIVNVGAIVKNVTEDKTITSYTIQIETPDLKNGSKPIIKTFKHDSLNLAPGQMVTLARYAFDQVDIGHMGVIRITEVIYNNGSRWTRDLVEKDNDFLSRVEQVYTLAEVRPGPKSRPQPSAAGDANARPVFGPGSQPVKNVDSNESNSTINFKQSKSDSIFNR